MFTLLFFYCVFVSYLVIEIHAIKFQNRAAILSVLAVILVIGCPALISFAESSDAVTTDPVVLSDDEIAKMYPSSGTVIPIETIPATVNDGVTSMTIAIPSDLTLTSYTSHSILSTFVLPSNREIDNITIRMVESTFVPNYISVYSGTTHFAIPFVAAEADDAYSADFSGYFSYLLSEPDSYLRISFISPDAMVSGNSYSLEFTTSIFSSSAVFSDSIVSAMLTACGILLIVCALYATPWVQVGSATAAAEKAYKAGKRAAAAASRATKTGLKNAKTKAAARSAAAKTRRGKR